MLALASVVCRRRIWFPEAHWPLIAKTTDLHDVGYVVDHSLLGLGVWFADYGLIDGGVWWGREKEKGNKATSFVKEGRGKKDSTYHNSMSFSIIAYFFRSFFIILFYQHF